ncbi:uncharacterized protein LOC129601150 [Paramacrobiotus metropolitanus]|uniref:uncharacterized protein LOC129601150 n=1 Tax=Paramacrobiotus metropolitanus TaxID=2943436 RepID=UPI00244589C4|nr:uncharacterized protein LOC129601150 [Paramacrobiotus metropolitanus]
MELLQYAEIVRYNAAPISTMGPDPAPIGLALFPQAPQRLMTPVCWDINVVMNYQGRRLIILATQDIPNCTGLQDLRYNELFREPFSMTRTSCNSFFKELYGSACNCRKCTHEYDAEINPLKCATSGCSNRIPSDRRASQPCQECGVINTDRLLQFRRFTEHLESIRNSAGSSSNRLQKLEIAFFKKLDAADILQGDAHLRFLCGWDVADEYFAENRFDDGWKVVQGLVACLRNIYPQYHFMRAGRLSRAAIATASALQQRVLTALNKLSKPAKRQLKALSAEVMDEVTAYGKEAEHIFRTICADDSTEIELGRRVVQRIEDTGRSIEQVFRNNKIC